MNIASNLRRRATRRDGKFLVSLTGKEIELIPEGAEPERTGESKKSSEPALVYMGSNGVLCIEMLNERNRGQDCDSLIFGLHITPTDKDGVKFLHFEIFIQEFTFQKIQIDKTCVFRLKIEFKFGDNAIKRTDEIRVSSPIIFDVPAKFLGFKTEEDRVEINWSMEIFPFDFQKVSSHDWLVFLFAMCFSQIVPQIREYSPDWPVMSWIRQSLTSKDASVSELFELVAGDLDIDMNDFKDGWVCQRTKLRHGSEKLVTALFHPPAFSCDKDRKGLKSSDLFKFVESFTRNVANECGYTYKVLPMAPKCHMRLDHSPHLLAFVPILCDPSYYVSELISGDSIYFLYALVREEEGEYTATYYSPGTMRYYDYRKGNFTKILRRPPPICNSREQYLFFLFVRKDLDAYFYGYEPLMSFRKPVHNGTVFYECNREREIIRVERVGAGNSDLLVEYYPYDEKIHTYPSVPLSCACGDSLLVWYVPKADAEKPHCLVWVQEEQNQPRPVWRHIEELGKVGHDRLFVIIRENYFVEFVSDSTTLPVDSVFEVPLYSYGGECVFVVHFIKEKGKRWEYCRVPMFIKAGPQDFDKIEKIAGNGEVYISLRISKDKATHKGKGTEKVILFKVPNSSEFAEAFELRDERSSGGLSYTRMFVKQ